MSQTAHQYYLSQHPGVRSIAEHRIRHEQRRIASLGLDGDAKRRFRPVLVNGVHYPHLAAASAATGLSVPTINKACDGFETRKTFTAEWSR